MKIECMDISQIARSVAASFLRGKREAVYLVGFHGDMHQVVAMNSQTQKIGIMGKNGKDIHWLNDDEVLRFRGLYLTN